MLGKGDLRKMAREIGAELRYVTYNLKPFSGHSVYVTKNNGRTVMYVVNYVAGKRVRSTVKRNSAAYNEIISNIIFESKADILKENYDAIVTAVKSFADYSDMEVIKRVCNRFPNLDRETIMEGLKAQREQSYAESDWAKQPYKQLPYMDDTKIHVTSRGLRVRSKSELALCELFYELGIEFRYEEEIILGGKVFGPDFTIRRKSDGKIFYWEHCGMMDVPKYRKRNAEKLSVYEENGIVPWDNLIITYDKDGSIDLSIAEALAKAMLCI